MLFFRPTYAEIDLSALVNNFRVAESYLPENSGIMAMVKADAYGHGAVQVSKKLQEVGVASLGVATVEEGVELRDAGVSCPIIVMGGLMGMGFSASGIMVGADLTPVIHTVDVILFLEAVSKAAQKVLNVHLKIDTGMTRLGVLPAALDKLLAVLEGCKHIKLEGVMTHFAEATDAEYTAYQMNIFKSCVQKIEAVLGPVNVWHVANSAALVDEECVVTKQDAVTWARPGLMLFGAYPSEKCKTSDGLKPVMTLKSSVMLIKSVPAGTKVSYGCTFTTARKSRLGVVPIGYADGYRWSLSNKGYVLVKGARLPVVGRVTMDMIVIDITDADVHIGDEVVLLGRQGDAEITASELADIVGTIPYEIFCGISKRIPRMYVG